MKYGYNTGEKCGRNRCDGIIEERDVENCSCHINPPCAQCTEPREYCPVCGYDAKDDHIVNDYIVNSDKSGVMSVWEPRSLDSTKIDWRTKSHTHFTQVCEGVYPEGTSREEVEAKVKGTFGGRFCQFGGGTFKYIAYTD